MSACATQISSTCQELLLVVVHQHNMMTAYCHIFQHVNSLLSPETCHVQSLFKHIALCFRGLF